MARELPQRRGMLRTAITGYFTLLGLLTLLYTSASDLQNGGGVLHTYVGQSPSMSR